MFSRYQKSCEWHDSFTWHRKDHAFHHHSQKDSDISRLLDKGSDIGCEEFGDSHTKRRNDKTKKRYGTSKKY